MSTDVAVEDLSRDKQQKAKKISIDPPGVEKLSRRQELSRSIHQVSRSCRDCDMKRLEKLYR